MSAIVIAGLLFVIGLIVAVILWVAGDYLSCTRCTRRKCFLAGHDVMQTSLEHEIFDGKALLICRRCGHSVKVNKANFSAMYMYLSAGYLTRGYIWKKWNASSEKNPFDREIYDEKKIF